ncbi:hypothetical protein ACI65C_002103 [Semiaphis heraclei]
MVVDLFRVDRLTYNATVRKIEFLLFPAIIIATVCKFDDRDHDDDLKNCFITIAENSLGLQANGHRKIVQNYSELAVFRQNSKSGRQLGMSFEPQLHV